MIITLKGANFSGEGNNIGTLKSYSIRFSGNVTNSSTSVDRETNTGYATTIVLKDGYELNGSITVTMGGTDITSTAVSGLTIDIQDKVTGNVVITVPTKNTATGEEGGEGGNAEVPEGAVLITSGSLAGAYYYENGHFNATEDGGVYITDGETTNYFFITYIPVQPNTQYRLAKARDTVFVDSNKNKVARFNINSLNTDWVFTTPANCAYMSTCVSKTDVTDYTTMELETYNWVEKSTTLLSEIDGVEYRLGGIKSDTYTETTTEGYFTYENIPVTANNQYRVPYARASWYLDSSKNPVSSFNPTSLGNDWKFTIPDGKDIAYINCVFKVAELDYTKASITEYERGGVV